MKINKPKFWDNKNSKILPYLLLPLSLILIGINSIKKIIIKKKKLKKLKQYVLVTFIWVVQVKLL